MTILREHHHNGTPGQPVNVAREGYDLAIGEQISYVSGGVSGGASATCPGTGYGYLIDQIGPAYVRTYLLVPSLPTAVAVCLTCVDASNNTVAQVHLFTTGEIGLTDGFSWTSQTSYQMAPGTWCRIEWHTDTTGGTQELRVFDPADSTTPTETITSVVSSTAALDGRRVGQGSASHSPFHVDEVALADEWPGPYVAPSSAAWSLWDGATEAALSMSGVWDGTTVGPLDGSPQVV